MSRPRDRTSSADRRCLIALTAVFVASRLVFHAFGVRFDMTPLVEYWQYLDPKLLEGDLLRSVFYLHSQPPLFNLFLGTVLKLSPVAPQVLFHSLYLMAGLWCHLATFVLMRVLGVGRVVAGILSTILVVRPSFILFENWLMYDVPVTALLCLSAVWLALFIARGSASYAHALFFTLLLLCATRSLFHLAYFGAVLALLAALTGGEQRRIVLRSAVLPLLLLTLLYAKNVVLFGHFGPSTWLGMNLARIAIAAMPPEESVRLVRQGKLSETAAIPPFSSLDRYAPAFFSSPRYPDVPALAHRLKSTGAVNYNHEAYIGIARRYLSDSLWIVHHQPDVYLHGVAKAWYNYFKPQTEITHVSANRDRLGEYAAVGASLLYGRLPVTVDYGGEAKPIYLFSTVGIPLVLLYALWRARRSTDPAPRMVLSFMALTVIYVALVGNSFEVWENQRFRFYTDPFLVAFLGMAAARARNLVDQRRRWR